ncbi:hypothetical protein OHD62_23020 [Mesorhizobium sp. YC-39]|uniref:hypothetical protein n=1 Tax=unclassified Mesorhizobium TaxID=325217 RepID=UPI0021E7624F|nr:MULTISPECIES: hypothetical protein [unclassified Mesorhizobium]MCV3209394.1 hypothetical protein [Mesorhizobium sp. YC-2]MCV3231256.1 hypothetical protein [Mesorhizobium sp. YC-39]
MKLALSAILVLLAFSQSVEAKTKVVATGTKAATANESRPQLDDKPTGGITASSGAMVAPAGKDGSNPYPPAIYFNF